MSERLGEFNLPIYLSERTGLMPETCTENKIFITASSTNKHTGRVFNRPKAENETSTAAAAAAAAAAATTTTTTITTAAAAATTTDKFKTKREENPDATHADRKKSRSRRGQHIEC
jgi:hypothetical protein